MRDRGPIRQCGILMNRSRHFVVLVLSALLIHGCGGGSSPIAPKRESSLDTDEPRAAGLLRPVANAAELLDSIKTGFTTELNVKQQLVTAGDVRLQLNREGDAALSGQFSSTYTQEADVDEHDFVKYDGDHLYIAPSRGLECCFAIEPAFDDVALDALIVPIPDTHDRKIRILATDPETATVSTAGSIELAEDVTVEGLYLQGDQLATITSSAWWGSYGRQYEDFISWSGQAAGFQVYDVHNLAVPSLRWDMKVDGGFVSSRLIDQTVYFITRHTPSIDGLYFYPVSDSEADDNASLLDELTIEMVVPDITINGTTMPLFAPEDCYVLDPDNELAPSKHGFPTLTSIIAIDLSGPNVVDALCYNEPAYGSYVSENAIYLTQGVSGENGAAQTLVHKFSIGDGLGYAGSGKVNGSLWARGDQDFRISEFGDYLRLVTTTWQGAERGAHHDLYVLAESATAVVLETVATLPNEANPEPIGKPGEDLYGVRFLGDRAYLVTFERIDPLFVIDLADQENPRIAGELEVTGFSDFLHPVSDVLLLGLGQDAEGLVKLELFDISDMSEPTSLGALSLAAGSEWSYSDARYNRHAFTYLADFDGVDRFTVPVNSGFFSEQRGFYWEDRLHLLEIRNKGTPAKASMVEIGHISATPRFEEYYGSSRNRAVIHNDAVFYVNGEHVWSALWSDPAQQQGPH